MRNASARLDAPGWTILKSSLLSAYQTLPISCTRLKMMPSGRTAGPKKAKCRKSG
jgi:hypothetical protein